MKKFLMVSIIALSFAGSVQAGYHSSGGGSVGFRNYNNNPRFHDNNGQYLPSQQGYPIDNLLKQRAAGDFEGRTILRNNDLRSRRLSRPSATLYERRINGPQGKLWKEYYAQSADIQTQYAVAKMRALHAQTKKGGGLTRLEAYRKYLVPVEQKNNALLNKFSMLFPPQPGGVPAYEQNVGVGGTGIMRTRPLALTPEEQEIQNYFRARERLKSQPVPPAVAPGSEYY